MLASKASRKGWNAQQSHQLEIQPTPLLPPAGLNGTCSFVLDRVCLAVKIGTQAGPGQLLLYRGKVDAVPAPSKM